jgi:hypothetical protein
VAVLIVLLVFLAFPALSPSAPPRILPPDSKPYGLGYAEWSVKWWKWAYKMSRADSPLLDATGAKCAIGQSGPVWFLAATLNSSPPITRSCTISAGKALFFPVANAFRAAEGDFAQMRKVAITRMNQATGLRLEIDGIAVQELPTYRVLSPEFALVLAPDNIFDAPGGVYSPAAADGIYIMLEPFAIGRHTIHVHAVFSQTSKPTVEDGPIDVTYVLTIRR